MEKVALGPWFGPPTLGAKAVHTVAEGAGHLISGGATLAGKGTGYIARGATKAITAPAGLAWRNTVGRLLPKPGMVGRAGRELVGIAGRAPVTAAMTLPFAVMGLKSFGEAGGENAARGSEYINDTVSTLGRPGKVVTANKHELAQFVKIASVLEKQSAVFLERKVETQPSEKTAAPKFLGLNPKKLLMAGAALSTGAAAAGMLQHAAAHGVGVAGEKIRSLGQDKRFAAMRKAAPSIPNNKQAREVFGMLDRASPYITDEPILAASAMNQILAAGSLEAGDMPHVDMNTIRNLLDVERARIGSRFPGLRDASMSNKTPIPGYAQGHGLEVK